MSPASSSALPTREVFSYSLPGELRTAVLKAHDDWNAADRTARLSAKRWLNLVDRQLQDLSKFKALSAEVREDGFTHLLLLSTDGTGVAPAAFSQFSARQSGCLHFLLLDSTDPSQVKDIRSRIDPARTLFCVSCRSGDDGTGLLARYFFDETMKLAGDGTGQHFLAVASPDALAGHLAADLRYRRIYSGDTLPRPSFSAFSDFGLVPYAAAGHDTERLLKSAKRMVELSKSGNSHQNSGVSLGLLLSTAAEKFGRDKVTLLCSPSLHVLEPWVEQLIAESARNERRGLVPILREAPADNESYGPDRLFVYLKYAHDHNRDLDKHISELEHAGHAVVCLVLEHGNDLGQMIVEWQIAAQVASASPQFDPFITPDSNRTPLPPDETDGSLADQPLLSQGDMKLFADPRNAAAVVRTGETLGGAIRRHLDRLNPGDYFALLAYVPPFPEYAPVLHDMRQRVLESEGAATLLGFGPRASNSAAITCLDGPNTSVILLVTCDDGQDIALPSEGRTLGAVKAACAHTCFRLLAARNRRIIRIHLGSDLAKGLNHLHDLVCAAIEH